MLTFMGNALPQGDALQDTSFLGLRSSPSVDRPLNANPKKLKFTRRR